VSQGQKYKKTEKIYYSLCMSDSLLGGGGVGGRRGLENWNSVRFKYTKKVLMENLKKNKH
jgi:hypothetical protein